MRASEKSSTRRGRRRADQVFRFSARHPSGKTVRGTLRAESRQAAWVILAQRRLEPLDIRPRVALNRLLLGRVSREDLLHTTRQLAVFSRAGVPLLDAIDGMLDGLEHRTLRATLREIAIALREGQSLSVALRSHPRVFPPDFFAAIRAAEATGALGSTLDRLADYLERDIENRRKITAALAYPSVILVVATGVVILLTTVIMPRFDRLFASLGTDLPFSTWLLLAITRGIRETWPIMFGLGVVVVLVGLLAVRYPSGRLARDRLVLRLPFVGPLIRVGLVERFCRSFGSMALGGVPLLDAMRIGVAGTNNEAFRSALRGVEERLLAGEGLSRPLRDTGMLPSAALRMIRAGEQTATLPEQLLVAADFYEKELDYRLKRFTSIFEPAVMVVAGVIVGFVAVALVSAIYGPLQSELFQ